jgi:hypothetical protein
VVECNLAKVEVAGSNPVSRSTKYSISLRQTPEKVRCKLGANFSGVVSSGNCPATIGDLASHTWKGNRGPEPFPDINTN